MSLRLTNLPAILPTNANLWYGSHPLATMQAFGTDLFLTLVKRMYAVCFGMWYALGIRRATDSDNRN